MLMLPNMYKIAGELTPAVFHVAARTLAAQALSIFGDHQDVMAARTTGFAMLASASVQEAHDMALIAQAATLEIAYAVHSFFRRFPDLARGQQDRVSLRRRDPGMIDDDLVFAHRNRALNPDNPFIRGTAQNPDVYFQAQGDGQSFYAAVPRSCRRGNAEICGTDRTGIFACTILRRADDATA